MVAQVMNPTTPSGSRRKNQVKLLGIFAIAGIPVLLAVFMYFIGFAIPSGKTNKGVLLPSPLALSDLGFEQDSRGLYPVTDGKWVILQTGFDSCDQSCMEMLYSARQVNVLMGREQERVARLFVSQGDALSAEHKEQYPQLVVHPSTANLDEFYEKADLKDNAWHLWVVDPNGNIILRYDASHNGYDLRDDLKKLLKLSNIG
jgi:cytochrome oxidase Cu insertion factor (SCO1/SenC/PrrC family)